MLAIFDNSGFRCQNPFTKPTNPAGCCNGRMTASAIAVIRELRMERKKPDNLVIYYIYLATSCVILGVVITFVIILTCQYFGIDIYENLWVLAIPVTVSAFLNVGLIELYRKYKRN